MSNPFRPNRPVGFSQIPWISFQGGGHCPSAPDSLALEDSPVGGRLHRQTIRIIPAAIAKSGDEAAASTPTLSPTPTDGEMLRSVENSERLVQKKVLTEADLPPSNETATGARIWKWSQTKEDSRCHEERSLQRSKSLASCVKRRSICLGVRRFPRCAARLV
jgi:hypothetical protein